MIAYSVYTVLDTGGVFGLVVSSWLDSLLD